MCCGCFEVFHIGHLEYLEGAKALGDILVVGVNSDQYIQEHKQRKPIFNVNERMRIIQSLSCVDYVFEFSEETFDESLSRLCPKIFAKGVDRTVVLEEQTCLENGIEIVRIGEEKKGNATELRRLFLEGA